MSRIIKYFAPSHQSKPETIRVSYQSYLIEILEDFHKKGGGRGFGIMVACLPRYHTAEALQIQPLINLSERLTAVASRLEFPDNSVKFSSLALCDEDEDNIQFFIRIHTDQKEFIQLGEERDHQSIIENALSSQPPSSASKNSAEFKSYQDKHPIHIGRPAIYTGPSITIYEEVFADIVDDLSRLSARPDNEQILRTIGEFAFESLNIWNSESDRENAVYPLIETLPGVKLNRHIHTFSTSAKSDAIALANNAIYLRIECNNELGEGGIADFEGSLAFLKHVAQPKYTAIRNTTCCPCIHVSILGPYISFGGSILTDIYSFQSFTEYMYLVGNTMTRKLYDIAKVFDVFRNALIKLRSKYNSAEYSETRNFARLFPSPAYMDESAKPDKPVVFKGRYNPYRDNPRLGLFHASYDGQPVLVKFSERYCHVGHKTLADKGLAPQLFSCSQLRGGVHMTIMEYIDWSDAHREFGYGELPNEVVERVKAGIEELHGMDLVHGDVRRLNILVKKGAMDVDSCCARYRTYLVDFDSVGQARRDRYTPFLNMNIPWPLGVCPGGIMEKMHDNLMLETIAHTDT